MSKYIGAGNAKIVTRDQGGGNKKSGGNTSVGNSKSTTNIYRSQTGPINYTLACVNQLGGISRGRSQFRNNADGKRGIGCLIQELNSLITFINNGLNLSQLATSTITYELVIAGSTETVIQDLATVNPTSKQHIDNILVDPTNATIFGKFSNNSYDRLILQSPSDTRYIDQPTTISSDLQTLINRANSLLKLIIPVLYTEPIIKIYGIHELAVLSNVKNVDETGKSIKNLLNDAKYGLSNIKSSPPLGIYLNSYCCKPSHQADVACAAYGENIHLINWCGNRFIKNVDYENRDDGN